MNRKIQQLAVALLLAGVALTLTLVPTRADSPPTFLRMWGFGVNTDIRTPAVFEICTAETTPCYIGSSGSNDGQFNFPTSVDIDSSGNVYVVDGNNNRIQKFDSDGNFLDKWGTSGGGNGAFNLPSGVAVDSTTGHVYVADSGNNRIQKFTTSGVFSFTWGITGTGDGEFNQPLSVAVDSTTGYVYVADTLNHRIQKFTGSGVFSFTWGTFANCAISCSDGQFYQPSSVAVDSLGNVYVADTFNNRIQKFDSDGNFLLKWGTLGQFVLPAGVTVDSMDNVYVAEKVAIARIQKFDSIGTFLTTWGGTSGAAAGQLAGPNDVAVDSAGNIYVAEESNHRVQKFGPEPSQVALNLTKTVNNDIPRSGDRITYTISVENSGSISATNAVISDTLPADLTFAGPVGLEGTSGTVALNAGNLPTLASGLTITNGTTITITFPVTVNTGLAPNTVITNTAAVTSSEVITPQTGSTLITANAVDLKVLKYPSKLEDVFPNPGQLITYTITVENSGAISATNAVISDTLPDGLTFAGPVEIEGSSGTVAQDASDLPNLASGLTITNGSTITVTMPVTVNTGQDNGTIIFNTAAVTSDEATNPEFGLGFTVIITLNDTIAPTFPITDLLSGSALITPTQGITLDTLFPLFEWYVAWDNGQTLTYLLTLSSTLDIFSAQSTSISFTTSQTSFVFPITLTRGVDYFWTVQAQDAAGNVNSPPIPAESFSIAANSGGGGGGNTTYLPIIVKN